MPHTFGNTRAKCWCVFESLSLSSLTLTTTHGMPLPPRGSLVVPEGSSTYGSVMIRRTWQEGCCPALPPRFRICVCVLSALANFMLPASELPWHLPNAIDLRSALNSGYPRAVLPVVATTLSVRFFAHFVTPFF